MGWGRGGMGLTLAIDHLYAINPGSTSYQLCDLGQVTSPLCTQLSAFIYWDSSKCLPQGMVLKIQEFRVNELRHGKASSIVPGIQKLFKMC